MNNLKGQLQTLLEGRNNTVFRSHPELKQQLEQQTAFLNKLNPTLAQRLYHIYNDLTEIPICPNCQTKPKRFISCNLGYAPYCGTKCANSCPDKKETTQQAWVEKYGSKENRIEHVKKACKKAMLEKTGYESNFHNPDFQKNFNGGKFAWDEETRSKREQTCLEKYGTKSTIESEHTKQKTKKTYAEKYENEHPMRDATVIANREARYLEKHGVANPTQNPAVKEKIKESCLQKFGVPNPAQRHIKNIELWNDANFIKNTFLYPDSTIKYKEMMEFFGCLDAAHIKYRLSQLGIEYRLYSHYSSFENQIKEFIITHNPAVKIVERNRHIIKPYEIDLYLPEYKLGIEFHGLLWHSFGYTPPYMDNASLEENSKHLHKTKYNKAHERGIKLLQIFENEWESPIIQNIWKTVILESMNKNRTINACDCSIKEINALEANSFLQENHLQQGAVGSTHNIGIFKDNTLCAVASFGKSRFKNIAEWELFKYAPKTYTNINNGLKSAITYFTQQVECNSILMFSNNRFSCQNELELIGFINQGETPPAQYYYHASDKLTMKHRINFKKHKLQELLDKFDPELTETQNMYENGYRKIYDAGQLKFVLEL